jgi:hypothetical protein
MHLVLLCFNLNIIRVMLKEYIHMNKKTTRLKNEKKKHDRFMNKN